MFHWAVNVSVSGLPHNASGSLVTSSSQASGTLVAPNTICYLPHGSTDHHGGIYSNGSYSTLQPYNSLKQEIIIHDHIHFEGEVLPQSVVHHSGLVGSKYPSDSHSGSSANNPDALSDFVTFVCQDASDGPQTLQVCIPHMKCFIERRIMLKFCLRL